MGHIGRYIGIIGRGFLENGGTMSMLPLALRELNAGNTGFLKAMIPHFQESVTCADMGLHYTIQCYEEAPFNNIKDWEKAANSHPLWRAGTLVDSWALHVCKNWHT